LDKVALGVARKVFATSRNVADRLERSTGIAAEVMPHPPLELTYRCDEYGDFILSVGRLDRAKRIDLLIEAAKRAGVPVVIAGDGPDRARLESLANSTVRFAGRVSKEELAELYAGCLAVFYAPVDEDFGMVPYEAFLSEKPVVATTDAGGPLEVVTDRATGLVCEPRAEALAGAFEWLTAHREDVAAWGRAGRELAQRVTWDATIDKLLA
jgi:glycosyltransferase involved in cell wall biosynthesis